MSAQASLKLTHTQHVYEWLHHPWLLRITFIFALSGIFGMLVNKVDLSEALPVKKVRVMGALVHVNETMLSEAIAGKIQGGYFSLNVAQLRNVVENMAWVNTANVRRVWPDAVSISVIEEKPVAIWNHNALVNDQGNVFTPEIRKVSGLPEFIAPEGTSQLVMEWFRVLQPGLEKKQLGISKLIIDARRAITLELKNGVVVVLGREAQLQRLSRFLFVFTRQLHRNIALIKKVDLRYSNGLAVEWNQQLLDKRSEIKLNGQPATRARGRLNHV